MITPKTVTTPGTEETFSFAETLQTFLSRLPARSRDIMEARFGIAGSRPKTLEEIGRSYRITRERVRQVIGSSLGFLAGEREHPALIDVAARIRSTLEKKSGIMDAEELLEELSQGDEKERGALLAFLECLPIVEEEKAAKEHEKAYRLRDCSLDEWQSVKEAAKEILVQGKHPLEGKELYARFKAGNTDAARIGEKRFFDFLAVAKEVKRNVFGMWGLSGWNEIKPRGTREKAYLVLKTAQKPMHFREIATLIDRYGLQGKKEKSHPQTVHNELIKDKRFVLVGRGIYALSEWGYKKGTVREVVEEILRESGRPLTREEILEAVLKVRQVKKSTVIINLNTFFARTGKNAYDIKSKK